MEAKHQVDTDFELVVEHIAKEFVLEVERERMLRNPFAALDEERIEVESALELIEDGMFHLEVVEGAAKLREAGV